jgi:hypothetical protein
MKRLRAFGSYVKVSGSTDLVDYGYFHPDRQEVVLNTNHNLTTQQRTLAHELTHVIEDHYGFELAEDVIDKIGIGWLTLLQENKHLVQFLTKEDK